MSKKSLILGPFASPIISRGDSIGDSEDSDSLELLTWSNTSVCQVEVFVVGRVLRPNPISLVNIADSITLVSDNDGVGDAGGGDARGGDAGVGDAGGGVAGDGDDPLLGTTVFLAVHLPLPLP